MKIELIDFGAVSKNRLPRRAYPMDAGADVFSPKNWNLKRGQTVSLPLGFGIKVPNGLAAFIWPKSGLSQKGIMCELPPIDASYTGQVHAILHNSGNDSFYINEGDKIGQLVILPCVIADFVTTPLDERGGGAFGSTGV